MDRYFRWCGSSGNNSPDIGRLPSFLDTKKNGKAWGDFEGMIHPVLRCFSTKSLQVFISARLRE